MAAKIPIYMLGTIYFVRRCVVYRNAIAVTNNMLH